MGFLLFGKKDRPFVEDSTISTGGAIYSRKRGGLFHWEGQAASLLGKTLVPFIMLFGPRYFCFLRPYPRLQRRKLTSARHRTTIRVMQLFLGFQLFFLRCPRRVIRREVFRGRNGHLVRNLFGGNNNDGNFNNNNFVNCGRSTHARFSTSRVARCSGRCVHRFIKVSLSRGQFTYHTQELAIIINARILPLVPRRVNMTRITNIMMFLLMDFRVHLRLLCYARQRNSNGRLTTLFDMGTLKENGSNFVHVFTRTTGVVRARREAFVLT